jgi:hypothetical protein
MTNGPYTSGKHRRHPPNRHWKATVRPHPIEIVLAALLIVVGLVVGSAQVLIYLRQASIMDTQAEIAKGQFNLSRTIERAILLVDGIDLSNSRAEPDTLNGLNFVITLQNGGRSIATIDEVRVIPLIHGQRPGVLSDRPNYHAASIPVVIPPVITSKTFYLVVGMQGFLPAPGFTVDVPDTNTIVQRVRSGDMPFDIYGVIRYKAGVGWDWNGATGFCYRYVPLSQRSVRQFEVCEQRDYTYAY